MSTILSVEKLEQLQTAVDRIVEARHANENLFGSQAASEEIIKFENMPDDLVKMLEVVKQTQNGKPSQEKIADAECFDTVEDFCNYCSQLAF